MDQQPIQNIQPEIQPQKPLGKTWKIAALTVAGVLVVGGVAAGSYYLWQKSSSNSNQTACTMEAKQCADGSYVSRTGPNCEFATCPSEALCEGGACPKAAFESLLNQSAELKNYFEQITEKYPSLSSDKFQKKESLQIEAREGFSKYNENNLVWTISPDKAKAVSSLGYYGEPDSSLEIYNRVGDNKVELLKTCGTPCSYLGEFWLNNNQFVFIQKHEYYPSSGEIRCTVNTKCTAVVSVSLYDLGNNTETIFQSPEVEKTDLNNPLLLPSWSWPARDLQIKAACEGLYGVGNSNCQQINSTADWQTYRNNELGFEFSYPADFGEINFTVRNGGDAGKLFYGKFTQNKDLVFGGIDYDFAEGRGGSFLDTQGFIKKGGEYYKKFVQSGTQSIEKDLVKEITIDGMNGIIIQGKNYDGPAALPSASERGALLNLNGERFKGIGFLDTNNKELSSEIFDQIISTFKLIK